LRLRLRRGRGRSLNARHARRINEILERVAGAFFRFYGGVVVK